VIQEVPNPTLTVLPVATTLSVTGLPEATTGFVATVKTRGLKTALGVWQPAAELLELEDKH